MEYTLFEIVCIPNGIAIVLLLVLVLSARRSIHHVLLDERVFYMMVMCNLLQCVGEIAAYRFDGCPGNGARMFLLCINTFLFINNISFAFLWTIYADYKIFEDLDRIRRWYWIVAIPGYLVIVGSILNLFVPVFYQINSSNIYERTALFWFPYAVTYFYLAFGVVLIYRYRHLAKKYLFLPALLFMVPIFLGSMLQYFFYGLSFVWIGVAIALVSLYVNVQNEVSYTDSLSGLFTRNYMYQYLNAHIGNRGMNRQLAGIMLDVDQFKLINDNYGHLVGDEAIQCAGEILRNAVGEAGIAIRFAGDEFIILQYITKESDVQNTMANVEVAIEKFQKEKKKDYSLSFSKGYAFFNQDSDTIDSFLMRLDQAMYEDKNRTIEPIL